MFSFLIPLWDANKFTIASVTSVVFLAFAGLTLAVSTVALVVSAPLFIIFSPILVPATIATTLLATGLTAGATLGLTAIGLIMGLIKTAERTPLALSAQRPLKLLKFWGGYWGFWGGKTFSGSFGDILKWLRKQPWYKGIPAGGAAPPAAGAAPPAFLSIDKSI
ncbi:oleosin-B2-like [Raphanus sativus]|uniref:Oleosin-B2-like n=1 Tax=Raphanus sativus TaxID=3726 RepID=A0A9W3C9U2_RAPSA|nr:oleosin-B2-like [Raphanus sativus]